MNKGKILLIVAIIGWVVCLGVNFMPRNTHNPHEYPLSGIVTEVNRETDIVSVEDCNSFIWQFEGCEDWYEGCICAMIMDDNGTEIIFDDKIIVAHYCGWIE